MMSSEKNRAGPTSLAASIRTSTRGLPVRRPFEMFMRVLDHDNRRVDHRADRNRDAAETHDVGRQSQCVHADIGNENAERQRDDGDKRASQMQQEHDAHQGDDQTFLEQRRLEGGDRAIDEVGTVVDGNDGGARRQASLDVRELCLDVVNHGERVLSEALHGNTGDDFAFSVQFGDTAPLIGSQLDMADVLDAAPAFQHRP